MKSLTKIGKVVDQINVQISYRIIELFSAGLYSSPNKAVEELVCNSYDAFATTACIFISPDLAVEDACIWVCDNGDSMDQGELKNLWRIGESAKRLDQSLDNRRPQIGRFGIGKLATYVLANNLTYICKKDQRFLAVTMDYTRINKSGDEPLTLDEKEITEEEAKRVILPLVTKQTQKNKLVAFNLFGEYAEKTWTFSILTSLKPKAIEIKPGRLKWVLRTALPMNPGFILYYNGELVESSKIAKPLIKKWNIGENDKTADSDKLDAYRVEDKWYIDLPNLKKVHGYFELYEDSLVDGSKSSELGRSHGIFLFIRDRLINLDDPLLGMNAFVHGVFNRLRVMVYADGLDENLTSTRESVRESEPYTQLKKYIKKKIDNEIRRYYFEEIDNRERTKTIAYRLSMTGMNLSKRPLYIFAQKYFDSQIIAPKLIEINAGTDKDLLLRDLKKDLASEEQLIKEVTWEILDSSDFIAKLELNSRKLKINLMHPYIANFSDAYKDTLPLQFIAITEVLTEASLYELGIDEEKINIIMSRRDSTLKELALSNRESVPIAAQYLQEALSNPDELEKAVCKAFLALGFSAKNIGGKGKPDGIADARLGFAPNGNDLNYKFTFDAKSTTQKKIQANTTHLATINKHRIDYSANFAVVVAIDFEGSNDSQSVITTTSNQQRITVMRAKDLIRLLLISIPKQIGLSELRTLFETSFSPMDVAKWIDNQEKKIVNIGPVKEIFNTIFALQDTDTEPPEFASVRLKLKHDYKISKTKEEIKKLMSSFETITPSLISIEGEYISLQGTPEKILSTIHAIVNEVPNDMYKKYYERFMQVL